MAQHIATYDEKFVKTTIYYVDTTETNVYLYEDAELTNAVTKEGLVAAAYAGPIVVVDTDDDTVYTPVSTTESGISYVYEDSGDPALGTFGIYSE